MTYESLYTTAVLLMILMAMMLSTLLTSTVKPSAYHTISSVLEIPSTATIVHSIVSGLPVVKFILLGAALMLTFGVGTNYNKMKE